ncbi:MAG: DUF2202 domain-containing protein [Methanomicrobiaceae archaeon]|nr:DUF2202 domain-containing protein [Methanomicrobiaceae archaeon]
MRRLSDKIKIISAIFFILAITAASGCVQSADKTTAGSNTDNTGFVPGQGKPGSGMGPGAGAGPSFQAGYYDNNMTGNLTQELAAFPVGVLTEKETADILYMAEEEKLARDSYLMYFDVWGLKVFMNIAGSEQMHMDSMQLLIDRYGLENPVKEIRGEFTDAGLQAMYNSLISSGTRSSTQALNNSVLIEETDINDLENAIADTDKPDLILVYNNLLDGSKRHLDSFIWNLEGVSPYMEPGPVILLPDEDNNTSLS